MSTNLEYSAVVTALSKVRFHFNPTEGQYQKMFKLSYNFISPAKKTVLKILQAKKKKKFFKLVFGSIQIYVN